MNQIYPFTMKARATRALKMTTLFVTTLLLVQMSMAQSGDDKSTNTVSKTSAARSYMSIHPGRDADQYVITVQHPSASTEAQLKLVDISGKVLQQVSISKNSLQTKLNITGLASGNYKIVWSDGSKTLDQPLMML